MGDKDFLEHTFLAKSEESPLPVITLSVKLWSTWYILKIFREYCFMSLSLLWGLCDPPHPLWEIFDPFKRKFLTGLEQNIGRLGRDVVIF